MIGTPSAFLPTRPPYENTLALEFTSGAPLWTTPPYGDPLGSASGAPSLARPPLGDLLKLTPGASLPTRPPHGDPLGSAPGAPLPARSPFGDPRELTITAGAPLPTRPPYGDPLGLAPVDVLHKSRPNLALRIELLVKEPNHHTFVTQSGIQVRLPTNVRAT